MQIFRDVPSLLLLFYMTEMLKIPPALAGVAIFVPKLIWSVFCDFGVGLIAERTRQWFSRRYYLLGGALVAPAAMVLLFWPAPEIQAWARALQISAALAVYMTAFSFFSVPHLSLGTELASGLKGQSMVMGWRTAFTAIGLMFGGVLAPMLVSARGGGTAGYSLMAWVLAGACFVALLTAFIGSKTEAAASYKRPEKFERGLWSSVFTDRFFLFTILAYFSQLVGQGCAYATESYLFVFSLQFTEPLKIMSYGIMLTVIGILIAQPFLVRITHRFGSKRTFQVGSVLYSLSLIWMALGPTQTHLSIYLAAFALGLTASSCTQSAYTRLSEAITSENARAGAQSRAGLYSSMFVANDKIAFALGGALIAGTVLSTFGFQPGGFSVRQSPRALSGIVFAFAGIPAIFNCLAIILMNLSPDSGTSAVAEALVVEPDGVFPHVA